MENPHVGFGITEHVGAEDIHILYPLIFHEVGETLLLYTCHIENVCIGDDFLIESGVLLVRYTVLFALDFVFLRHGQFLGGHKMESRIKMTHSHDEGVDGTAVF